MFRTWSRLWAERELEDVMRKDSQPRERPAGIGKQGRDEPPAERPASKPSQATDVGVDEDLERRQDAARGKPFVIDRDPGDEER
jgi:hypothetical protein